jgi:uncharacterized protein
MESQISMTKLPNLKRGARESRNILAALVALGCTILPAYVFAQQNADSPHPQNDRASMQELQIPSHGALLNGFVYVAAGAKPHPLVILLHGFPGNERNLDIAQDIRRAGWDVLYFDYRGSWGSPGDFSFTHCIEDAAAAISYLREPSVARTLRLDPARIVLIGHSMGGFVAVQAGALDPAIMGVGLISAVDLGGRIPQPLPKDRELPAIQGLAAGLASQGMAPLAGCTPQGLAREIINHASLWNFPGKADALKSRPVLIVTSDDGFAAGSDALAKALSTKGEPRVTTLHLSTDHSYSDRRRALSDAVVQWLAAITGPSPATH